MTWVKSSFSTLVNWYPLSSVLSTQDGASIDFFVTASEVHPTLAVEGFRAYHITDSELTIP
jgi:hypothetical protein